MAQRVVVVDDHAGFRREARSLLEAAGFDVVGEAATGATGLETARLLQPDIVLLDVVLPDMSGFDVAGHVASWPDAPAVVLISSRDEGDYGDRVERSPAVGFIPKAELTANAVKRLVGGRR